MKTPLSVLLVEDSAGDAGLILRQLDRAGYAVAHRRVDSAEDMRAALSSQEWDLVIADYVMPQFDAPAALEILKDSQLDVPFIVVSGSIGEDIAVRMMKSGAHDYLLKNNLARLVPAVQRELRETAVRRERKRAEDQLRIYAQVFDGSCEAAVITDADKKIVSVNRAFSTITGYGAEEVLGRSPLMLSSGRYEPSFYDSIWTTVKQSGYWLGEIWSRKKSGEVFPQWLSITALKDNQGNITHYVSLGADITEQKLADERIHYLAHYDSLTRLPNRTLLWDRISRAMSVAERNRGAVAILFIDLDRFKNINDSLGHYVGDQLLQAVAERLGGCVREMDTVGRLGGDEFVVALPDTSSDGAARVAMKILNQVSGPYQIESHYLIITPSIGISIYPEDGADIDALIKNADAALYHAKDHGRNNYQFFTRAMNIAAFERMSLENGLRLALERGEFVLQYQPQLDTVCGRVTAIEALVRWHHPEWGLVMPERFIPVAEDSGLIVPLGAWILGEACRQVAAWQGIGVSSVPVAVNLSAVQFRQKDFHETVGAALCHAGLDARCLQLELTESTLMQDEQRTTASLQALSALGVQLVIDDFGTGYSSLTYLKRFAIDKLKIDRSFVLDCADDPDDAAIVRAVISLAHSLRLKVIAEGVETMEQFRFLRSERCDEVQGNYFSPPLLPEELTVYLQHHRLAAQS